MRRAFGPIFRLTPARTPVVFRPFQPRGQARRLASRASRAAPPAPGRARRRRSPFAALARPADKRLR
ncbi:hypothetical protein NW94_02685 [Burkholderia mallei]|uniref:Uncharacterized protein n=1 Tax=Burkholderia mallei (strain NCTC 10229) TaxID=412022 RepID=A2S7C5_BURM9|nr:hypothetical protein BMA10229_A1869 [Burkholderia mallei NCTC 10229]ABO05471.1 hypothetical protein BMA10247_2683 [Burkholderia mallei NCTC 10247]AIW49408.1 hypothetical protein DM57_15470 [Burkholderia mallei]EDK54331.1 hypothetical protein BMAFMH_B0203 [Burkholderia mallei FMH]EDK59311.1 hypothetical protein BMAJHU_B0201 [Burkholderia mallei JHU]EDK84515.1 hypothetical protein BMA721280_E0333 [Burkholderia mallei 2002721280]EDP86251.1 hypothetical protein BMA10399_D0499 [Burkholderia mal